MFLSHYDPLNFGSRANLRSEIYGLCILIICLCLNVNANAESPFNWNVRTDPIGWIHGANARVDYRLGNQWTLGPAIQYVDARESGVKINVESVGMFTNFYFNQAFADSWFLELGLAYGELRAEANNSVGQIEKTRILDIGGMLLGGYHWFWERFNLCLGLGINTNSAGHADITDEKGNKVNSVPIPPIGLAADISVGWAF